MNGIFRTTLQKKEFKVPYDALKCANLSMPTGHNAVYGLEDVVLVLLHVCKNESTVCRLYTNI